VDNRHYALGVVRRTSEDQADPVAQHAGIVAAGKRLLDAGALREAEAVVALGLASAVDETLRFALDALGAEILYQRGQLDAAEQLATEIVGTADGRARLEARQTLAKVALAKGDFDQALSHYTDYREDAEALNDALHVALAWGGKGVAHIRAGDLNAARFALEHARTLALPLEEAKPLALAAQNLAVLSHLEHDWASAADAYALALDALGRLGNRASLVRAAYNLGELYESLGDLPAARRLCNMGDALGGGAETPSARAEGLLLRGRIALSEESWAEAQLCFDAAWDALGVLDPERGVAALLGGAEAAARQGSPARAEKLLATLPKTLLPRRRIEAELARASWARAKGQDGRASAERAVTLSRELGDPCLEVAAALASARALADAGLRSDARAEASRGLALDRSLEPKVPEASMEAFRKRVVRRRLETLVSGRARSATGPRHPTLVGRSPAMQALRERMGRFAQSSCAVLIEGESGTGKELVAMELHALSPRAEGSFVHIDCASISDGLVESTLFGHERGAFTDAVTAQRGCFERAHGGTLLLDAIDEASPRLQAALLRALGEGQLRRVGAGQARHVDVRVLATTRRPLRALVDAGEFREDLLYRLEGAHLILPPLRARPLDLPLLAEHLLARGAETLGIKPLLLTHEALRELGRRSWPGNVRELDNTLRAAALFAEGDHVDPAALGAVLGAHDSSTRAAAAIDERDLCYRWLREEGLPLRVLKKEIERACVMRAMDESEGTISKAAALLGMKRPRLSQLVSEYRRETEGEGS